MTYLPIREAAQRLSMSEEALQTFCRRRARQVGEHIVAEIADGITAYKMGRLWRVSFPGDFASLKWPDHPGVYVIEVEPSVVKIGVATRRIRDRVRSAQTYQTHTVRLLAWFDGGYAEERAMHERFASLRIRMELFRLDGELLTLVKARNDELSEKWHP